MNLRRWLPVLILLSILLTARSNASAGAGNDLLVPAGSADLAAFESELEALRQALHIPGMAAAVVQDQALLWAGGFGYADVENQVPATADTPFHLASVTKPIAATLIMQLVEEGRLELDDPVSDYGVHLASDGVIRVWHLLTHTSQGVPGTSHDYSGDRYGQLEKVIAGASGQPFGSLLAERVLVPLEMDHTAPNPDWGWEGLLASMGLKEYAAGYPAVYDQMARPYQLDGEYNTVPGWYPLHFGSAAGLIASVTDLARFDIALDQDKLLRPETRELMFTPAADNDGREMIYGLGWYTQMVEGTRLVWHSGGWPPSVSALMVKVPDENLTFIILANNHNMTRPYPLGSGDVLTSTPALIFFKHFVFPQIYGVAAPAVDWLAGEQALVEQLKGVDNGDVAGLLERELISYRKLYAAGGRMDVADKLWRVHRRAYPASLLLRDPVLEYVVAAVPETQPAASLMPGRFQLVAGLILGWVVLVAVSVIVLAVHFARRVAVPRPVKAAWLVSTLGFGPLSLAAYALGGRQFVWAEDRAKGRWRAALGPTLFSVTGTAAGVIATLYVYMIFWPDRPPSALFFLALIAIAFLAGWLLFHGPFQAWMLGVRYGATLGKIAGGVAISTLLAITGMLPVMVVASSRWFPNIAPNRLAFTPVYLAGALAAALLVYPYQVWAEKRQKIPKFEFRNSKSLNPDPQPPGRL